MKFKTLYISYFVDYKLTQITVGYTNMSILLLPKMQEWQM